MEAAFQDVFKDYQVISLEQLQGEMVLEGESLNVKGSINWAEARSFLRSKGRDLMTYPTETSACFCLE